MAVAPGSESPSCWRSSSMETVPLLAIWPRASSARATRSALMPIFEPETVTAWNMALTSCADVPDADAAAWNRMNESVMAETDTPALLDTSRKNAIWSAAPLALPVICVMVRVRRSMSRLAWTNSRPISLTLLTR